jgi:hypothetical protein
MRWKIVLAPLGVVAVLAVVVAVFFAVAPHRQRLNLMATVRPDTAFRIFRRRADNNHWDKGSPYDRTNATALLAVLASATQWDHKSHAAATGFCTLPPGYAIDLAWGKDLYHRAERGSGFISIRCGNWLFDYENDLYQVSQEGHEVLHRLFPDNG